MGAPTLALAVSLLLSAQADEPQMVVLPLEAEGVKEQLGLDAWKAVVAEIAKSKSKLKVGVSFQKELHDMLLGPAREQARDCGSNIECLRDIGRALDCGQLIAGKVTKDEVTLLALDVASGQKLGTGKSSAAQAKSKVEAKSRAAAQALVASILKTKKGGAVVAEAKPAEKTPPPAKDELPKESAKQAPLAEERRDPPAEPIAQSTTMTSTVTTGTIRIAKEQLAGVREVTIDGSIVVFSGDGSIEWTGAAGTHALVIQRNDGSREARDIYVDAGRTNVINVSPPQLAQTTAQPASNVTQTSAPPAADDESVTSTWWFWTAIATAVLAGGATSVVLAGGLKGGPSVPNDKGTVSGTY